MYLHYEFCEIEGPPTTGCPQSLWVHLLGDWCHQCFQTPTGFGHSSEERMNDECPLVKWCAVLYWVQWTQYGCIINIHNDEPKGAVDKSCIYLHSVWWRKKRLEDISSIWRKMKHFSKSNGSICIALEGLTLACVLLCFYMDDLKKPLFLWLF